MNILNEEWRDISGFEGLYQVSDHGRVRSCDRNRDYGTKYSKAVVGRILKLSFHKSGYFSVGIHSDSKTTFPVHSLVAKAFLGDRPDGYQINHIDGAKTNNFASNLEYCTRSQNIQHAYDTGLMDVVLGDNHHSAKLCSSDIPIILDRLELGHTLTLIAADYGVCSSTIYEVKRGTSWKLAGQSSDRIYPDNCRKLTPADIPVIRDRIAMGHKLSAISKDYEVNAPAIHAIKNGVTWKHIL